MSKRFNTLLQYTISFLLTFVFLYFAFKGTDFAKLMDILARANYWWILAMIPPLFISHVFRTWRWAYLMRPIKRRMKFRNLFSALIVGYMLNNVLPRVGEVARPYAIGKLEGVSKSAAFGTVLVERIFDMISFLVVAALIPVVYTGPLNQVFPWLAETGIWITVFTLAVLALLTFLMLRRDIVIRLLNFFTRRLSEKSSRFIEHTTHSFLDGFLFLKEPRSYFMIFILSILVWVFYIIMMFFPFYAFGMTEKYSLDMGAALVVQAISSIGFMLPTPGATGSYHYFVVQTLTRLYGVGDEVARSYAAATHAAGYIATTIIGIYYFLKDKLHIQDVKKSNNTQENGGGARENR